MIECGVPLHFEGLLSCYGEEIHLLENWCWALQALGFCHIILRPNPEQDASAASSAVHGLSAKVTGYNEFMVHPCCYDTVVG